MKIIKENSIKEAVKPMDFKIEFSKGEQGVYTVFIDGHKEGLFDDYDTQDYIKFKLDFLNKFKKLVEKA